MTNKDRIMKGLFVLAIFVAVFAIIFFIFN